MTTPAPAGSTVLPPQAPRPAWWRLPAERPSGWVLTLRATACVTVSAAVAVLALPVLAFSALALVPACTYTESPALQALGASLLALSLCLPVAAAGRRLWWLGLPMGLLSLQAMWGRTEPIMSGPVSGFCF